MKFDEYWRALITRNTDFQNETTKITMTVASVKQMVRQAHEIGVKEGIKQSPPRSGMDILDDLMGRGK